MIIFGSNIFDINMDNVDDESNWDEIDSNPDPEYFVNFLREVSNTDWVNKMKESSYQALQPEEGNRILDVGCGVGTDVQNLAEYVGPTGIVVGIDNSQVMIDEAKAASADSGKDNIRFMVDDAQDLTFDDGEFDRARTERVLQHLPDPKAAIAELKRVTKTGGFIFVGEPDWRTHDIQMPDSEIAGEITDTQWVPSRNAAIGGELENLIENAGFEEFRVLSFSVPIEDAEVAILSHRFKVRLKRMVESGQITTEEASNWLDEIRQAAESDQFVSTVSAFAAVARVPPS